MYQINKDGVKKIVRNTIYIINIGVILI